MSSLHPPEIRETISALPPCSNNSMYGTSMCFRMMLCPTPPPPPPPPKLFFTSWVTDLVTVKIGFKHVYAPELCTGIYNIFYQITRHSDFACCMLSLRKGRMKRRKPYVYILIAKSIKYIYC